jgi:hypothetical protein
MECPKCKTPNPDDKRFCGDCGAGLDPVDEDFRQRVHELLREHLKDQKLVEIETADAVIARLKTLAKPFLYTLALFITVLGVLGFRSMRDFFDALKSEQASAVQKLRDQASSESKSLAQEAETIRAQYRKLGDQQDLVAQLRQTEAQLKSIQTASQGLKQRYEQLGTELATAQSVQPAGSASAVPSEAGIRSGGANREGPAAAGIYAVGSSGPEVLRIQRRLRELGCYNDEATGEYDQATKAAVSKFNEARGDVLAIGVVDSATSSALFAGNRSVRCR